MTPGPLLEAVLVLGGVGLSFGALIALADRKLRVWEDPRIDAVTERLPGANCGACGFAGCRAFAEATIHGQTSPAACTVMSPAAREEVAEYLGVSVGQAVERLARLLCAGGSDVAPRKALYFGVQSCAAAVAVGGGGKGCSWGCVGLADCAVACDFEAIEMGPTDLPRVIPALCTACGDCVEACPLGLFEIMPLEQRLIVQCRSLLQGAAATEVCAVACDGCGRCAIDAAPGLIEIRSGLAVIDYERIGTADISATRRCPTGAIAWVEGAQFGPTSIREETAA